jgi:hypothetical protein
VVGFCPLYKILSGGVLTGGVLSVFPILYVMEISKSFVMSIPPTHSMSKKGMFNIGERLNVIIKNFVYNTMHSLSPRYICL